MLFGAIALAAAASSACPAPLDNVAPDVLVTTAEEGAEGGEEEEAAVSSCFGSARLPGVGDDVMVEGWVDETRFHLVAAETRLGAPIAELAGARDGLADALAQMARSITAWRGGAVAREAAAARRAQALQDVVVVVDDAGLSKQAKAALAVVVSRLSQQGVRTARVMPKNAENAAKNVVLLNAKVKVKKAEKKTQHPVQLRLLLARDNVLVADETFTLTFHGKTLADGLKQAKKQQPHVRTAGEETVDGLVFSLLDAARVNS